MTFLFDEDTQDLLQLWKRVSTAVQTRLVAQNIVISVIEYVMYACPGFLPVLFPFDFLRMVCAEYHQNQKDSGTGDAEYQLGGAGPIPTLRELRRNGWQTGAEGLF